MMTLQPPAARRLLLGGWWGLRRAKNKANGLIEMRGAQLLPPLASLAALLLASLAAAPQRLKLPDPTASEVVEEKAGYTLGDIEDPVAARLMAALFEQLNEMQVEIDRLKEDNAEIHARMARAEERSESTVAASNRKIDKLVIEKDAGVLSEGHLSKSLASFGVKEADAVAPRIRSEGIFSLAQLVSLNPVEQVRG